MYGRNDIGQMWNAYKNAKNPDEFMAQMVSQNPILSQFVGKSDPQKLFYELCRRRGVDPETILSQFK